MTTLSGYEPGSGDHPGVAPDGSPIGLLPVDVEELERRYDPCLGAWLPYDPRQDRWLRWDEHLQLWRRWDPERQVMAPVGQEDLPYTDGMPMDSHFQVLQIELLKDPLWLRYEGRRDIFIGSNMFVYFSPEQVRNRDFLGPDVLIALGVSDRKRWSWVIWEEGKSPDVLIEVLSPNTARFDKRGKKDRYQNEVKAPEYYWHNIDTGEPTGFRLVNGIYQPIGPDAQGRLFCTALGLFLAVWEGEWRGVTLPWLRWAEPDGPLLPTSVEFAAQQHLRAEEAHARAEEERLRAEEAHARAEQQRLRAEEERMRAEQERRRAEEAERRIAELQAQLARLQVEEGPDRPAL